ncbi:NAD-dependent deacylase [Lutibacter sp.]|uniref:SIR2 family NAD-dependent protein deacylase n=1 Tax=Lutibacter sp. TaxID=1925666 RepID=UPI0027343D61|nr:NAD-dependent deacylase [Lutibacter sp.]MDP3312628.1 NAD-dependent deacylase [Lutibacter sp.]
MQHIVVLSGAGISAESGIKTFRDADGLWEGHDVMEVASPLGWHKNKELVLNFYNKRRAQLLNVLPNEAHISLAKLEKYYNVTVITQNVDDLHERAGSTNILHLHGELLKVRSTVYPELIYEWKSDLKLGDLCKKNEQLRPHIVWFGEEVPLLEKAIEITTKADILIIVGTSMQVYPAANLIHYVKKGIPIYFVDPKPAIKSSAFLNLTVISKKATEGLVLLTKELILKSL